MTYQVIARKWRPQTFADVTGQEVITQTLTNAISDEESDGLNCLSLSLFGARPC
jgi:hypothetical protein